MNSDVQYKILLSEHTINFYDRIIRSGELKHNERKTLWLNLAKAFNIENYEEDYLKLLSSYSQQNERSHEISIDVKRTLKFIPFEGQEYYLRKTYNVCYVYNHRNQKIGYIQGFNYIACALCMVLESEAEAYYCFLYIMEVVLPIDYFLEMKGVQKDFYFFECLLSTHLRALYEYMINHDIDFKNIVMKWLLCLYTYNFSFKVYTLLIDIILYYGRRGLVLIALGLMELMEDYVYNTPQEQHSSCIFTLYCEQFRVHDVKRLKQIIFSPKYEKVLNNFDAMYYDWMKANMNDISFNKNICYLLSEMVGDEMFKHDTNKHFSHYAIKHAKFQDIMVTNYIDSHGYVNCESVIKREKYERDLVYQEKHLSIFNKDNFKTSEHTSAEENKETILESNSEKTPDVQNEVNNKNNSDNVKSLDNSFDYFKEIIINIINDSVQSDLEVKE